MAYETRIKKEVYNVLSWLGKMKREQCGNYYIDVNAPEHLPIIRSAIANYSNGWLK